ncbi:hypothetical protein GWR56_08385 [Mucilaginibacter sp. 14171R-50]|uniref:hypothetical protein n=1 Tax=Mucilaginibacter sp. 14171R-50 TaxID=2703789 RepID=UPI00138D2C17|nr:hypothetical protein [Mucilaginibacter sp. 14171R-50]QHS55558.1 hypothetical protein GWR56_08385 [Mucilaginibacter sp. 14171R-50]
MNQYFRRPLICDYTIGLTLCTVCFYFYRSSYISLPKEQFTVSTASDLSTIALTLAGFILTLLTVLITFKSGSTIKKDTNIDEETVFEIFFATDLYFETVKHLKNCVKSLTVISVIGYSLKLFLNEGSQKFIYFFNILGLVIIALTLWRSLLILTRIINLQKAG